MKKIIIILLFLSSIYLYKYKDYNISDDTIRFRVISNSNKINDILMKEKVVNELSGILFKESSSSEEVRKVIYDNLEVIEGKIIKLFKDNNYDKNFNISYGYNEFPKKTFMGKEYNEGLYESLVIEIGEAKGDNYFCILYPSLCLIDYENRENNKSYGFKIVDVFKDIF